MSKQYDAIIIGTGQSGAAPAGHIHPTVAGLIPRVRQETAPLK